VRKYKGISNRLYLCLTSVPLCEPLLPLWQMLQPFIVTCIHLNMITPEQFFTLALSFPGTEQKPHFERTGFAITGKRMFATHLAKDNTANIFLSPKEQTVFCEMDTTHIYPVPNKWGEKGATTFELNNLSKEYVQEALHSAYSDVLARKK